MFKLSVKRWWNGDEVRDRLIAEHRAAIRALAEFVADRARAYCPVDTGELRDSIHVVGEADGLRHHVVATADHAEPVEFGHTMRNGRLYPANPFMRKALRDGANAMPNFIGQSRVRQGYHQGQLMGATFQ
jgi:HK97 gp10 family phage protein